MFIRKTSNTIGRRIPTGNKSRGSSARMMKSVKKMIEMEMNCEQNKRTRRDT